MPPRLRQLPLIWDLPTRLFHWGLAGAITICLWTGLDGGFEAMDLHQRAGYVALGLVAFRLLWGVVGAQHARFTSFLRGPSETLGHVRELVGGRPQPHAGHNPLAGWTVSLTLLAMAVQAVTGLFASDDLFIEGPLTHLVTGETTSRMTEIHHYGQWTVGGLVGLHLLAIALHSQAFGEPIIRSMVHGRRGDLDVPSIPGQRLGVATALAAGCAAGVWWVVTQL